MRGNGLVSAELRRAGIWDELRGVRCQCGRLKQAFHAFCWECYTGLPQFRRVALYQRMGAGLEEAYEAALDELARQQERLKPTSEAR